MSISRRYFLKSAGIAVAAFGMEPPFLVRTAFGRQRSTSVDRPVLVAIFQRGAADGLSMVPPFGDQSYVASRPQIAIAGPSGRSEESAIDLDGFFGLHPSLRSLKSLYDQKQLAIVHAVGSPSNTRSHFDAQDYMESGSPDVKSTRDGWLNRCLQTKSSGTSSFFRGVAFGSNTPRSFTGSAPTVAMTRIEEFDIRARGAAGIPEEFANLWADVNKDAFDALRILKQAQPQQHPAENGAVYPSTSYGNALKQIAQLVKSDIGLEVAFADIGGWDTHANQGGARGQLAQRLDEFAQGIAAFHQDLSARMRNIVVLTMTEFGRSVQQNGSGGTDHGHASALFVSGGPIKGGKVYGKWPGLRKEQLYEGRDLALTTDFRDVFSEVAAKHLGITDAGRIFPGFKRKQNLGIL